jgi:hypothetical protein
MRCGTSRVPLGDDAVCLSSRSLSETVAGVRTDDQRGYHRGSAFACTSRVSPGSAELKRSSGRHTP